MNNDHKALIYLRDQARDAHQEGDGVYVNHLASVALIEFQRINRDSKLDIGLLHVKWAFILPIYWLLDQYMLDLLTATLATFHLRDDKDREFKELLEVAISFVEQPLEFNIGKLNQVNANKLSWIDSPHELEDELLLQLFIEFVWNRDMLDNSWSSLAEHLKQATPPQLSTNINALLERLNAQTSLIYNDPKLATIFDSIIAGTEQNIAYGWSVFLSLDINRLEHFLMSKSLKVSFDSSGAVQISQLHNLYELYLKYTCNIFYYLSYGSPTGDKAEIRFARFRYQTATRKELQFDETRKLQWLEQFQEIMKRPDDNLATTRFRCYRLGIMRELSALREWNLASWFNSIKYQYLSQAELIKHRNVPSPGYMAYSVIRLGVMATAFSKDDKTLIDASYLLDTSVDGNFWRTNLIGVLLRMRPVMWPTVVSALAILSDSINESDIDNIIAFCLKVIEHSELGRRSGLSKILSFWYTIIPYATDSEKLCEKLWPIAEIIAREGTSFHFEVSEFSTQFIAHSKLELAVKYIDILCRDLTPESDDTYDIWVSVYNALLGREDLQANYLDMLRGLANGPLQEFYLDRLEHNLDTETKTKTDLKDQAIKLIMGQVQGVLEEPYRQGFGSNSIQYVANLQWSVEDKEVVEAIITAINSPDIREKEFTELIAALSIIVKHGDIDIATIIFPELSKWLTKSTYKENILANRSNPLDRIQGKLTQEDDVTISLIKLSLSMSIKLDEKVSENIVAWAKEKLDQSSNVVGANLFELLIYQSIITNRLKFEEAEGLIKILLIRVNDEIKGKPASRNGIHFLQKIIKMSSKESDSNYLIKNYMNNENNKRIVNSIQRFLSKYANSIDPDIRMLVGMIIRQWNDYGISIEDLKPTIDKLKTDARARVRFQMKDL